MFSGNPHHEGDKIQSPQSDWQTSVDPHAAPMRRSAQHPQRAQAKSAGPKDSKRVETLIGGFEASNGQLPF